MSTIDELLKYMKKRDKSILITNNQLSDYELNVVVVKILSWLKLEHKRSIWIAQGKKTRFKSLEVDIRYPWCANLYQLVENEKLFHDYFSIKEGETKNTNWIPSCSSQVMPPGIRATAILVVAPIGIAG